MSPLKNGASPKGRVRGRGRKKDKTTSNANKLTSVSNSKKPTKKTGPKLEDVLYKDSKKKYTRIGNTVSFKVVYIYFFLLSYTTAHVP